MVTLRNWLILIIKDIRRHPVMDIILLVQLILVLHISATAYTLYSVRFTSERFMGNLTDKNIYYIAPRGDYGLFCETMRECEDEAFAPMDEAYEKGELTPENEEKLYAESLAVKEKLCREAGEKIYGDIPNIAKTCTYDYNQPINVCNMKVYFLDDEMYELLGYKMKEGVWLSDSSVPEDELCVVATSTTSYKVGDHVPVNYLSKTGEIKLTEALLVGITEQSGYLSMMSKVGGSYIFDNTETFDTLYNEAIDRNDNAFLCLSSRGYEQLSDMVRNYSENRFIMLSEDLTDEQRLETEAYLQQNSFFFLSLDMVNDNTVKMNKESLRSDLVFIICIAFIVILGMSGFIMLNTIRRKKLFSIYYMVGMRWKEITAMNLIHSLLLCILAFAVETAILFTKAVTSRREYLASEFYDNLLESGFNAKVRVSEFLSLDMKIVIYMLTGIFMLSVISVLFPMKMMRNESPVEAFHAE